jgi:hypothetical protein
MERKEEGFPSKEKKILGVWPNGVVYYNIDNSLCE